MQHYPSKNSWVSDQTEVKSEKKMVVQRANSVLKDLNQLILSIWVDSDFAESSLGS